MKALVKSNRVDSVWTFKNKMNDFINEFKKLANFSWILNFMIQLIHKRFNITL
jgi:hypothetical protein